MQLFKFSLVFILSLTISCKTDQPEKVMEETPDVGVDEPEVMIIGDATRDMFKEEPYISWYDSVYLAYPLDRESIEQIAVHLSDIEISIFFGSWCVDSKDHLPAFFKIMDLMAVEDTQVALIGLDRDKKEPKSRQEAFQIEYVPTFIFTKDGQEIGRIIEFPLETLEKDILNILTKSM